MVVWAQYFFVRSKRRSIFVVTGGNFSHESSGCFLRTALLPTHLVPTYFSRRIKVLRPNFEVPRFPLIHSSILLFSNPADAGAAPGLPPACLRAQLFPGYLIRLRTGTGGYQVP